ncbi:hypothetical protein LTR09_006434 [Extremus antarcticus]|uniref:Uncharacterized protein n=1 Tax=Extremus antarcticus TaxID=702011 RepID=A0AAJ0DLD1_9PEZI|nr:hypothetical protein LTR09_006434 [Extremus antarcticus]
MDLSSLGKALPSVEVSVTVTTPPTKTQPQTKATIILQMQLHFAITASMATLLYQAGYMVPLSLATKQVALSLSALKSMDAIMALELLPILRRIVLLGNLPGDKQAAATAGRYEDMSEKELTRVGTWHEGFDNMTGVEIWCRMEEIPGA